MNRPKFQLGDRVHWINEQDVDLGVRTVTEVMKADDGPQRYRITNDTPWMYVREPNLSPTDDNYREFGTF